MLDRPQRVETEFLGQKPQPNFLVVDLRIVGLISPVLENHLYAKLHLNAS